MNDRTTLLRSLFVTSPVIVASVVSIIFSINVAANPSPKATFNPVTTSGTVHTTTPPPSTTVQSVTAVGIYSEFNNSPEAATGKYLNKIVQVQGVMLAWGSVTSGDWLSLDIGNGQGLIIGQLKLPKTFNKTLMPSYIGKTITFTGTCKGISGSQVIFDDISSSQLPVNP